MKKRIKENANEASGVSNSRLARRIKILDVAADAFTNQGYAATTLDSIGDALQATKGNIYYYFRSKADLFLAVHRRAMELNISKIAPIAEDTNLRPRERIYCMAHAHTMLMMEHHTYQRVTVIGLEIHNLRQTTELQRAELSEIVDLRDKYEHLFVDVIREGIQAKDFTASDPHLVAKPLLGALNWTTMWYRPRKREGKNHRVCLANQIADFAVRGLEA